jgi:two-component system, chemotaxis family, sensor kinase CheA
MSRDPALDTFLAEGAELVSAMESLLLRCEQGSADAETINELFRAAHTIKGSAGLFGLESIVAFTHVVESILDRARSESLPISAAAAAILLECTDHIGKLVESVAAGDQTEDPALTKVGAKVLKRLAKETGYAPARKASKADPVPAASSAKKELSSVNADGEHRASNEHWHISVRFGESVLKNGMDPLSFIRYLTTLGTLAGIVIVDDGLPALPQFDAENSYLGFEIAFATDADKTKIEAAFEFVREDCTLHVLPPHAPIADFAALFRDAKESIQRMAEFLGECGSLTALEVQVCLSLQESGNERALAQTTEDPLTEASAETAAETSVAPGASAKTGKEEARAPKEAKGSDNRSIRVDGDKLDKLIDWIGELIIAGAATGSIARQAGLPVLNESAQQLARIVGEIRDQALKLRMVQIGSTFSRFHRVVRDVARETGKDINLEIGGGETELDRTLVEGIADPLTHLVRNAIDHGIETPDVRESRGKSATGVVKLNAYHDAGSVVIEVADDGGGLKRDRIVQKATERGLITAGQVLTDEQVFSLIFEPGFSTAEQVTNLSGRGVGMDVVKRNITALRGTVEVHSEPGRGTRVSIRLPLTLAIIDGFQVAVGQSQFVIPLDLVEECVELESGGTSADAVGHISLHGSVLPLIRLHEMFDIRQKGGRRQSVVVVRSAGKRVGIVVDELMGELQAVIKPLSRLFNQLQGIGGSTILGTGKVALILDVPGLVARTNSIRQSTEEAWRLRPRNSAAMPS